MTAINLFRDLYEAMDEKQRQSISWIAIEGSGDDLRILGEGSWKQMISIAAAAIDEAAKSESRNYEEYREEVMSILKGLGGGFMDGGIDYYTKGLNH